MSPPTGDRDSLPPGRGLLARLNGPSPAEQEHPSLIMRGIRLAPRALRLSVIGATRVLLIAGVAISVLVGAMLLMFRTVDPPGSMLMLTQRLQGVPVSRQWMPLEAVSPHLIRAVVASEDANFCRHRGIDFGELEAAMAQAEDKGDAIVRGASTITMQVAKNLFLTPSRTYLRKGLEMGLALAIEATWPKRRILEVYLNIAEWGPGVFGIEAGSRHHFRKSAAALTPSEAALMAVTLPNPILRRPARPGPGLQRLAALIDGRARRLGNRIDCLAAR